MESWGSPHSDSYFQTIQALQGQLSFRAGRSGWEGGASAVAGWTEAGEVGAAMRNRGGSPRVGDARLKQRVKQVRSSSAPIPHGPCAASQSRLLRTQAGTYCGRAGGP